MTDATRRTILAGLGGSALASALPDLAAAQAKIVFRYANAGAPTTLSNTFNKKLSDTLSQKTNGAVSFQIFAGSLGGEQKLLDSMSLGSVDIYNGAYTGTREFDILYSAGFFKDGAHAKRVLSGELGSKASNVLQQRYQARFLGVGRLGTYNLMLTKPIASFAELKGRKIRSAQIEGCLECLKHFGAIPTPIPFNEIYLALQQGIVDGVLTALNPGVASKFYEVCKYVVADDFGLALDKEVISEAAWRRLKPDQQALLLQTFDELEGPDYYEVGLKLKGEDLGTWAKANGKDSVLTLGAAAGGADLAGLNRRLADEVYGAGTWEKIQAL